jgi:hypothetical protein
MDANEILKKAWEAVKASGVPEAMQDTAFKEAVAILRGDAGEVAPVAAASPGAPQEAKRSSAAAKQTRRKPPPRKSDSAASQIPEVPDEAVFFAELANESGVPESGLRDVLALASDGTVNVTPATRKLGATKAEQARTVVALIAPARRFALQENPVSAEVVRRECQRKNCFDTNNFASTVIGRLDGVNYGGSRAEIVVTSRWVDEFTSAINQALGRNVDPDA